MNYFNLYSNNCICISKVTKFKANNNYKQLWSGFDQTVFA